MTTDDSDRRDVLDSIEDVGGGDGGIPDPEDIDWGPKRRALEEGDPCPECGYEFDSDEWDCRHLSHGPAVGESWLYTCPNCEQETCSIGT